MDSRKKYEWIVSLRAIAAMAIVMLHVVSGWTVEITGGGVTGFRWFLDIVLIQLMVRWAVPVFVMMSGFLLLDPDKEYDVHKTKTYIIRMVIVLATVGFFYCLIETYVSGEAVSPWVALLVSLRHLIEGKSWSHMWYVYMLIGLYAFTPMLRCFVRYADDKTMRFTLAVLFLLTVVRPTVNTLTGLNITGFNCWEDPCLFYYLIGHYLSRVSRKRTAQVSLAAVGAAGLAGLLVYGKYTGASYEAVVGPANVFVACYSIGLFILCKDARWSVRAAQRPMIQQISKYSFGIYLFHVVFLNIMNKGFHIFPDILPVAIGEIAFFLVALLGAWLGTAVVCRIRIVRKILIK